MWQLQAWLAAQAIGLARWLMWFIFVQIVKNVQRSRRQEYTNWVAQQVQPRRDGHHLAPFKHLHQKDHHNHMPYFGLQLVEWADLHPLRPLLHVDAIVSSKHRTGNRNNEDSSTFRANMPNKDEPLSARSMAGGTPGGTFEMNNPYKPMANISITVPARYTSG